MEKKQASSNEKEGKGGRWIKELQTRQLVEVLDATNGK
jgi:hypothetical protein